MIDINCKLIEEKLRRVFGLGHIEDISIWESKDGQVLSISFALVNRDNYDCIDSLSISVISEAEKLLIGMFTPKSINIRINAETIMKNMDPEKEIPYLKIVFELTL